MPAGKHILIVVEDPIVRHTKKMVLEHIGFAVIAVATLREVEYVTGKTGFDLVVVGRSVSEESKRAIADTVRRNLPNTPILEACNVSPVISGADHVLRSSNPEDLAEMVKAILHFPKAQSSKAN
jgi:DNA-binding response OmpR family regulator